MRANLELTHGALYSQRALLALVEAGRSRDEAYRIVQENAQRAWSEGIPFRDLLAEAAPELDLDGVFDPGASCAAPGGSSRGSTDLDAVGQAPLVGHGRRAARA